MSSEITEITFGIHSQFQEIDGFDGCSHLKKFDVPVSVEKLFGFSPLIHQNDIVASVGLVEIAFQAIVN